MNRVNNLRIENLESNARVWRIMAQFDKALTEVDLEYLKESGLGDGKTRAVGCLGWIWSQWLLKTAPAEIRTRVEPFVNRGMEMQKMSSKFHSRPLHDLFLLHCAIFCSPDDQLKELASRVVDSSGFKKYEPINNGELYASAWCGMLKYWIVGDKEKAISESEVIWKAYRDGSLRAANKKIIAPWLQGNWKVFVTAQEKDFEDLWNRSNRNRSVKSDEVGNAVADMDQFSSVQQLWCWAHCGLAILAFRANAIEVATDRFWFPAHALARP